MAKKSTHSVITSVQQSLFLSQTSCIDLVYRPKRSNSNLETVRDSQEAYQLLLRHWDPMKLNLCEEFKICLLNAAKKVLGICTVSSGGIMATYVDSRHVIASALLANATDIILAHNHPSGNCRPSHADQILTQIIKKAADLFDITVADHLIITDTTYFSFATDGLL